MVLDVAGEQFVKGHDVEFIQRLYFGCLALG